MAVLQSTPLSIIWVNSKIAGNVPLCGTRKNSRNEENIRTPITDGNLHHSSSFVTRRVQEEVITCVSRDRPWRKGAY